MQPVEDSGKTSMPLVAPVDRGQGWSSAPLESTIRRLFFEISIAGFSTEAKYLRLGDLLGTGPSMHSLACRDWIDAYELVHFFIIFYVFRFVNYLSLKSG